MTFEEEYGEVLEELGKIEKDLEKRRGFLRKRINYDQFCTDAIRESEPKFYTQLYGTAGKETIDNVEYIMVFNEVLRTYDNRENGSFIHLIRTLCKKRNNSYQARENLAQKSGGILTTMPQKKQGRMEKLIREYSKIGEAFNEEEQEEQQERLWNEVRNLGMEKDEFIGYCRLCSQMKYLDAPVSKEDQEGMDLYETLQSETESVEDQVIGKETVVFEKILGGWEHIQSLCNKQSREYIQAFLTNAMLKTLKLDSNGNPYDCEPAGNPEIYHCLLPYEETLYDKIFYKKYLYSAFDRKLHQKDPEVLEEVYRWLLKNGFNLKDIGIAEAMGVGKAAISKKRAYYKNTIVPQMKKICGA